MTRDVIEKLEDVRLRVLDALSWSNAPNTLSGALNQIDAVLASLATPVATEPPSLVALVQEWQKRYDEMVTKKHRLREAKLVEAEEALFAWTPAQAEPAAPRKRPCTCLGTCAGADGLADGYQCALQPTALPASSPAAPAFECCWNCPGRALCLIQQRCVFPNESHGTAAKVTP